MISTKRMVGILNLEDGFVDATDPCYDLDNTHDSIVNYKVKPGKYNCYINEVDEGDFGHRIMSSYIVHEDYDGKISEDAGEFVADCGVDCGLFGFFNHKKNFNDNEWQVYCDTLNQTEYGNVLNISSNEFTTSSGYGDGLYNVNEVKVNNKTVCLKVYF